MQSDKDRLRMASGAPERSDHAVIPGESHNNKLGDGHGHDEALLSQGQQAVRLGVHGLDEHNGLGKPGLLGETIIPLSGLAAPHIQRHLQPLAPPGSIKTATLDPSRAPTSGDHVSLPLPPDNTPSSTMIFSDLYRSPRTTFSKLRHSFPHGVPQPSDIDADLVSRDKAKNKEAVKKYLAEKIRTDWEFAWPPAAPEPSADEDAPRDPGEEADSESDTESVYSTISEDPAHFRPRAEWSSDLSDSDEPRPPPSPFRFHSPEAVGAAVRDSVEEKRARRRRAVRDEMKWNSGLACFEARRNAWTGAKTVRVKPKPPSPVSPSSGRRFFWRHHRTQSSASHATAITPSSPPTPTSPLHPTTTRTSTATGSSESDSTNVQRTTSQDSTSPPPPPAVLYPVQTVIPLPPPLLPPQNPMRASVQPSMYGSLYDKVVVQSLQPSCPVNLADMLRACVVGWKRDGEWPPKSAYPAPPAVQTPSPEVIAMRQRKALQQRRKDAVAAAAAAAGNGGGNAGGGGGGNGGGRRLSFVGLFNGAGHHKTASTTAASAATTSPTTQAVAKEGNNNNIKDKEGKENGHPLGPSQSHSDEGAGSGSKALFRRSLQKVFSLGQHGHGHGGHASSHGGAAAGNGNAAAPLSPAGSPTKEVAAVGCAGLPV